MEHGRAFKVLSAGREMSAVQAMWLGRPMRVVGVELDAGAGASW